MAKSSPRRSLKSLFSRSEVNLNQSSEKDKNDGEKKKFRFPKFKIKSKNDSDSAPVKAVNESKELLSTAEPSNTAEGGVTWADNVTSEKKRASLYATAPRSKGKEFSYSELDLRKPKRFATFSFGFKKKKKNDETTMSKSTFSLQSDGIEEQAEGPLDLSQMELDQTNAKTTLGMSQPELDTTGEFGIPSPPPVAINQSDFSSPNPSEATTVTQPEVTGPLTNGSSFEVHKEPLKAPIATIPELQLSDPDSPEESDNIPVYLNSDPSSQTATSTATDDQTVLSLAASRPPTVLDTSDNEAVFTESDGPSNSLCDNDILQQSHTKTDISHTESTRVTLSPPQPDATDETDITTKSAKHSPASVDFKIDSSITESTPVSDSALDSASVHQEVSIYRTERSTPETATGVPTASAVSDKRTAPPVSQDVVYGALYESLFPHSFTSEVVSSFSNPPPQIHTEMRHLNTKSEPVLVKTRKECHTESNVIYSRLPASREFDSAAQGYSSVNAASSDRKVISSSESSRWTSSEPERDPDFYSRYSLSSSSEPGDKMSHSVSEMKSDRFSLIQDNVRSVPVVKSSAPPVSVHVTSQGTDTRVTDSKRRVILVKELVTEEKSRDPVCPSLEPNTMSATKHLEIQIETRENLFAPSGQMDGSEGPLSPAYLSVGSDDGSIMEVYYSAEEDNTEESEEMYTVDEREASSVGDLVKEAWLREESPQQEEFMKKDKGEFQVVVVKMQNKGGKVADKEVFNRRIEVEQQVGSQRSETQVREIKMSERLLDRDAESLEKEIATTVLPQMKKEGEEKLPAPPVQQVNMLMVCSLAPPSSDPHGQEEGIQGNQTEVLETQDHPNWLKQLPSHEIRYLAPKDITSSEHVTTSSNTKEKDEITPTSREAEEQVLDRISEASKFGSETGNNNPAGALTETYAGVEVATLTHSNELQSDATGIEYNRPLQSSEWVDTFTRRTDRTRLAQEQVAVKLSVQTTDTHRPDPKAAETRSERHPAEVQPNLNQGTLTAASVNQPPKADKESVDEMNSGFSSLSTKLSLKNSFPPKEDEYKYRFHKVSLIKEANNAKDSHDTVDFSKTSTAVTESNGTEISSDYKWRNRFEGVSQYKPYKIEDSSFSDSLSNRMSDSYTSTSSLSILPEATVYKHLKNSSSSSEERITLGNRLSDMTRVNESHESEPERAPRDEWRRSLVEQEEPVAPAGEREGTRESERIKSGWDLQELPVSGFSSAQQTSHHPISSFEEDDDSSHFTGVFKATLVELVSEPAALPSTPPASPEAESPYQFDMDNLVDTLKSMGPSLRPRNPGLRGPPPVLISSLPPIVEDAPSPNTPEVPPSVTSPNKKLEGLSNPAESLKGLYTLPDDLGLKRNSSRDTRSPLELMKLSQQDQPGTKSMTLPLRASASNSILMRKSSDSSPEELKSPVLNGNGLPSSNSGSRLENSVIFGSHRSASTEQTLENGKAHRPLFRTGSLPDTGLSNDRMSVGLKEFGEYGTATKMEPAGSRFERFSFLLNSPPASLGSLTGVEDHNSRISRPPLLSMGSPPSSNSPTRLMSPTGSIDFQRPFTTTDSPLSMFGQTQGMGVGTGHLSTPILQRSFSSEGTVGVQQTSLFNNVQGGSQFQSQQVELEKNAVYKYRAFPDAYLTKTKEHGKLNPRPGKMYIFDRPGMCGQRIEVRSDVIDATPWELQETISIRVIRGGWVLYEKPNFKGEKIALDEGDTELTFPFSPLEEPLQNGQKEGEEQNEGSSDGETKPVRRFVIGSLRRAVRDYSVPEISLFPEENAEGKKVIFRDTSDDARIFGFPIKANSIIINAGLWLVFAHPFFQGSPRVLEVGGYSNPAAWGVEQPYVGSLHPLKVGEPRVENMTEPKMVIYDKPYFSGKSRTITTNMRDFMTRTDRQQTAFMYNVGSLKVQGGIWVGYEKEGFRGHQYLLEEGEYHDWRVWGGCDAELRSVRVIRANLTEPMMVMFEQPEEEEEGMQEDNTFEVTEAIPDVELFEYKTSTRSIHVLSGAWIAYSHVDFSGNQYILEKGFYNNCADWGSQDTRICSVQPILLAPREHTKNRNEIILYSEPDFQGKCHIFDRNQEEVPEKLLTKSCRVSGGSWVLYENTNYSGNLYVLSEGDYPNFTSMGCPSNCTIRSAKVIPMMFSVPSISLFGLECLEGREITMDTEIYSMVEEGFNNHILSVRVNQGCWVICEHSNYRGRQFLLEPIEITNWPKFSSIQTIGSMYPVRQKRHLMRIKNKASGHYLSIQGGVEEMKSGRVVVTAEVEPMSDIWFYQDGLIKSKLSPTMSLQVMGNVEPAAKVVLWSETRQPIQTWTAQTRGLITSLTFPGCVLDVKGGKTYDKDHVVIMQENDERPSQQWEIELM